ncbi:MAG: serine/threonine protein kinase, partial [Pseudomonadales bacterium]|nr:serine/threonine protein kinase [Pseudomonadales bacterium]
RVESGLTLGEGLKILTQILSALQYAAAAGFVHRDIKPENILFRDAGFPLLSDFGIARPIRPSDTDMTLTGTVIGSPNYMSPEQAQATGVDGRSDLYSVGIILYEMLTGAVPFLGETAVATSVQHVTRPVPKLPADLAVFQGLLEKALAKEPRDRFQNGNEFIDSIYEVEKLIDSDEALRELEFRPVKLSGAKPQTSAGFNRDRAVPSKNRRRSHSTYSEFDQAGLFQQLLSSRLMLASLLGLVLMAGLLLLNLDAFRFGETPREVLRQESHALEIKQLLLQADAAIIDNRLFDPVGNNAFDYLQKISELAPDHARGQSSLRRLLSLCLSKAQAAIQKKEIDLATLWLDRASQIQNYHRVANLSDLELSLRQEVMRISAGNDQQQASEDTVKGLEQSFYDALQSKNFVQALSLLRVIQRVLGDSNEHATGMEADYALQRNTYLSDRQVIISTALKQREFKVAENELQALSVALGVEEPQLTAIAEQVSRGVLRWGEEQLEARHFAGVETAISFLQRLTERYAVETDSGQGLQARVAEIKQQQDTHRKSIQLLVQRAAAFRSQGQYIEPDQENALALYNRILRLQPGDKTTQTLKRSLLALLVKQVDDYIATGQYERASAYALKIQSFYPKTKSIEVRLASIERYKLYAVEIKTQFEKLEAFRERPISAVELNELLQKLAKLSESISDETARLQSVKWKPQEQSLIQELLDSAITHLIGHADYKKAEKLLITADRLVDYMPFADQYALWLRRNHANLQVQLDKQRVSGRKLVLLEREIQALRNQPSLERQRINLYTAADYFQQAKQAHSEGEAVRDAEQKLTLEFEKVIESAIADGEFAMASNLLTEVTKIELHSDKLNVLAEAVRSHLEGLKSKQNAVKSLNVY